MYEYWFEMGCASAFVLVGSLGCRTNPWWMLLCIFGIIIQLYLAYREYRMHLWFKNNPGKEAIYV